jgi:uncharacterized protein YcbK (DUF882 family)
MGQEPALSRRAILFGLTATVLCAPAYGFSKGEHRVLHLYNTRTKERFDDAFWSNGRFHPAALQRLSVFLRDHHTERVHRIDPELPDLLHELQSSLGGCCFDVLSGYRDPATNAKGRRKTRRYAKNSYHLVGKAVDIRVAEVGLKDLRNRAMSLERGGVGCYSRANYIHVDTGPMRRWGR